MQLRLAITNNLLVELHYGGQRFPRLFAPHLIYRRAGGEVIVDGLEMLATPVRRQLDLGHIRWVLLTLTGFEKDPVPELASAEVHERIFPG